MSDDREPRGPDLYERGPRGAGAGEARTFAGATVDGRKPSGSVRFFVGAALVLFGTLWTLENLGWNEAGDILRWWPVLVLAYGVLRLTGSAGMAKSLPQGLFFGVLGLLLVLARIAHLPVGLGVVLPLLTIFAGARLVRRALTGEEPVKVAESSSEVLEVIAILGAATSRARGKLVSRGDLTAVMGGVDVDLREARPASDHVTIEVFACMGAIDIVVPETWRVESDILPILGAFEDKTVRAGDEAPACTLILRGTAVMGGVIARNRPGGDREVHIVRRTRASEGEPTREGHAPPPPVDPS